MKMDDILSGLDSLETTVPTDMTVSQSESDETGNRRENPKKFSNYALKCKQLSHDIQCLKLELSRKETLIDNLKLEHTSTIDDLRESLNEAIHRKKLVETTLVNKIRLLEDENKNNQLRLENHIKSLLKKQETLEKTNCDFTESVKQAKISLDNILITENEFQVLMKKSKKELDIQQYASLKVYELTRDLTLRNQKLKSQVDGLKNETNINVMKLADLETKYGTCNEENMNLLKKNDLLIAKIYENSKFLRLEDNQHGSIEKVKKEKDALHKLNVNMSEELKLIKDKLEIVYSEHEDFRSQNNILKQQIDLLTKNRESMAINLSDLIARNGALEERCTELSLELDRCRNAKELLSDKLIKIRENLNEEYQKKVNVKVEEMQLKLSLEFEKNQRLLKEMHDKESRALKTSLMSVMKAKDREEILKKDILMNYEKLLIELKDSQSENLKKISELTTDLKIKTFQYDQLITIQEESKDNLENLKDEKDVLKAKNDSLQEGIRNLHFSSQENILRLENQLSEKSRRLDTFEKIENEFNEGYYVVDEILNGRLISNLYDCLPKEKQLEFRLLCKHHSSLKRDLSHVSKKLETEISMKKKLEIEITENRQLLNTLKQPESEIIKYLRKRDNFISLQKSSIINLEEENQHLLKTIDELRCDLDKILDNREEMKLIRETVNCMNLENARINGK